MRIAALTASLLVTLAINSYAQLPSGPPATKTVDHQRPWSGSDDSPCTGAITYTGQLHTSETVGTSTYRAKSHEFGQGDNPLTGAKYQYQNQTEAYMESSEPNFTQRFSTRKHIIRASGPAVGPDDWFVTTGFKVRVVGGVAVMEKETDKAECR